MSFDYVIGCKQIDGNRGSFRVITSVLLFICLSLISCTTVRGKPFRASNRTGGYNTVQQSLRQITVGRNAFNEFKNNNNNNNNNMKNNSKVSAKSDFNSGSEIYSYPTESDSRDSEEWGLQFDPNYFASLNAANHRPVDAMMAAPTDTKSKVNPTSTSSDTSASSSSSSSGSSADNTYYYSPETYGKTTHKNHKTSSSYAYLYPSSSSTSTTTTSTSTTPSPKSSHNRFGEVSRVSAPEGYSEPAPPYTLNANTKDKQSANNYNYEETPEDEEEPNYYDTNEEIGRKYYYPTRNKQKKPQTYSMPDYYGTDLSSMSTTNEKQKVKSVANSPASAYGAQEETVADLGGQQSYESYESGGNIRFPSKYYGGGTGAYYPSYSSYPSFFPSASEHSYGGGESLLSRSSSWLGPGVAGLLLGIGLPLGLLVATMLPAIMSVPIVQTATVGRKKRELSDFDLLSFNNTQLFLSSGVLDVISKYGMPSLEDPQCLSEMFCAFAAEGRNSDKNLIQTLVFQLIDWTPKRLAKWLLVDTLFNAIRQNTCQSIYKCMSRKVKLKDNQKYKN